jgi:hypothetical protein
MVWTVIYSTLENGIESFITSSSHDGDKAWDDVSEKLRMRYGPECSFTIFALVKGSNPVYTREI